jgi:hypothetical protein
MKCKNCDNDFNGNYCNVCGQKVLDRLTFKSIWNLIVDDVFEVNKGLLYTVKQLWINPGKTSLDFISGRTKNYYSPLKYLIFWTAVYLIFLSLFNSDREVLSIKDLIFNDTQPFSLDSIKDSLGLYTEIIFRHPDIFYLGLTPFLAMLSYLIYKKKKFYFTELSILYLYIFGQIIFFLAAISPILNLLGNKAVLLILFSLPLLVAVIYLVIKSHKEFFGETWIKSTVKGLAILYVGQLIYMLAMLLTLNIIKTLS